MSGLRSLHVPFTFPPDPVGGTEVYVARLTGALIELGHPAVVAAPDRENRTYLHNGVPVHRFAIADAVDDVSELYGDGDAAAVANFAGIVDRVQPDVVHLHAFTRACSVRLVRDVCRRGIPVVFTYHTPTVSCQRGTLLEFGAAVCDGRLDVVRCAACALQRLGGPAPLSRLVARTPAFVGDVVGAAGLHGGAWTALRMSSLIGRRLAAFRALVQLVDRFVALVPWVRALLRANGVPEIRIVDSAHGTPVATPAPRVRPAGDAETIRIAHLGRADAAKGTGLLIRALKRAPADRIALDVFAIAQSESDRATLERLRSLAGDDARIRLLPPIDPEDVAERLVDYDAVAVPSQSLETGPLVVLEASAAGVPVIGSMLPGIAEKIRDGVDGLLVQPHDSADAWADALERCGRERDLLATLRRGVRAPRTTADVAADMASLYRTVAGDRAAARLGPPTEPLYA